jgi:signal transduction histidine kinase
LPTDDRHSMLDRAHWSPPDGRSGRRRPPWWPEGEPWPPQNREAWQGMSRRFVRRAVRFAAAAALFIAVVIVALAWLLSAIVDEEILSAVVPAIAVFIGLVVLGRLIRGVGRAAAPVGDLIEASGRVEAGEFGTQVAVRGPREVRSLARAFNSMSARLAESTEDRRRLLADVSHELRTPLSVIRGNVEGMIDGLYPADRRHLEHVLTETRQMERLIEDLRTLSLADAGALALHREPIDLAALARDAVAGFEPQAREAGLTLSVDATDVPILPLDPRRVRQVLGNVISNALRHTALGGHIAVVVEPVPDGVEMVVRDTGHGMDAEAVAHAFDRFWRSGDSSGAGLGLAIVRDLVEAHDGTVTLESQAGMGTVVRCRFPVDRIAR